MAQFLTKSSSLRVEKMSDQVVERIAAFVAAA
jgi:hypothetical protein